MPSAIGKQRSEAGIDPVVTWVRLGQQRSRAITEYAWLYASFEASSTKVLIISGWGCMISLPDIEGYGN